MKNLYTKYDYQKAIEFVNSLGKTNEQKAKLVIAILKVFKSDSKTFRAGHFEECCFGNSDYKEI